MARQLRRATLLAPFILLAGFLAVSCFDNSTGPRVSAGRFSIVPQFASSAAQIVTLDRFRVLLRRTSDGTVALDTTIAITPGTDSVDLSLAVPMFSSSETFLLTLSLITPAGDTAFQAGPTTVTPSSTGGEPPAIPLTVVYTGVGSHAKAVQITTLNPDVFFGDTVTLAAQALDSNNAVIPGTPIAWGSLDTLRARVPNAGQGKAVGVSQRGVARITATLLNGPADTAAVLVQPKPVRMAVEAGNNQTAPTGAPLAQPVRFRVKAADSLGVANVVVRFGVVSGGGTLSLDSAVTNDSGRVEVQWTLGGAAGVQAIRARIQAAIPDSVVTASATGLSPAAASLSVTGLASPVTAGALAGFTVTARDTAGNVATGYRGTIRFTSSDTRAVLPANYTFLAADSGTHTFGGAVTFLTSGSQSLTASDTANASVTGSQTVTVQPGVASPKGSVITVSSGTVTSGNLVTLRLQARDSLGNDVAAAGLTVAFSAGGGTSTGTIGATTDSLNGVYTASFTAVSAGTATTIGATINGIAVTTTLPTVTVTGGGAAALLFTTEPTDATVNTAIPSFQVTARDAANNTATGFNGAVTVALQNNPAGGSLGGTVTVSAANGVATFNNVSITAVGSGYALQATAAGLTSAASQPFLITPVGMTHLWTGAADTVFANPANWSASPPGAPSSLTDVLFVPASAPRQPTLSANLALGSVAVETGATLTIDTTDILSVVGNLNAGYTSIKGPGMVVLSGSGTVAGTVPSLLVVGTYTASDSVNVRGDLTVTGAGHNLTLAGQRVRVLGNFATAAYGTLTMTNSADTLDVAGITAFAGGNTTGLLTAGAILARGDFTQVGYVHVNGCIDPAANDTVETFYATGAHRVRLIGTVAQQVALSTPGAALEGTTISECTPPYAGGSQFANLEVANPAGVTFLGAVLAAGNLTVTSGNFDATGERVSVAGNVSTSTNLTAATLEVGGTLSFGTGTYSVGTSTFLGSAAAVPTALPYQDLRLVGTGAATWPDSLGLGSLVIGGTTQLQLGHNSSASSVTVQGNAHLALGGHKLSLPGGTFQTTGNGTFSMTTPADTLDVGGFAYFQGGSTDGQLSGGTILISGDLYQYAATDRKSFRPSGNNKVVLNGTGSAQGVYFASPGDVYADSVYAFGNSRFQNLEVANPFGFILGSDVYVEGDVTMPGGGGISDNAPGHTLRATNITTPSLAVTQMDVAGTLGVSGTFTVGNTVFSGTGQSVPSGLSYQNLTVTGTASMGVAPAISGDLTVGASAQLDIGANTLSIPGSVNAGNTIIGTGTIQMTGVGKTLRGTLPNLDVAAGADILVDSAVTITGSANQTIDGHLSFGAPDGGASVLTVQDPTAYLYLNGPQLSMHEDLDTLSVAFHIEICSTPDDTSLTGGVITTPDLDEDCNGFRAFGTHKILMKGTGNHYMTFYASGSHLQNVEISGSDTVSVADMTLGGDLTMSGNGVLDVASNTITVGGNLTTTGSGALSMQGSGNLSVQGNAVFQGGSTAGLLTLGNLNIAGSFQQGGANAQSFSADPGHVTSFTGGAAQQITFANPEPGGSHFGNLSVNQPGSAGVNLASEVNAAGNLVVPGDVTGRQTVVGNGNLLRVGGLDAYALTLDHALLVWLDTATTPVGSFVRADSLTFSSTYSPTDVQFYVLARQRGVAGPITYNMNDMVWKTQADGPNGGRYMKAERYGTAAFPLNVNLGLLFTAYRNLPVPDFNACSTLVDPAFEAVGGTLVTQLLYTCS